MVTKTKQTIWTASQVKEHIKAIGKAVEKYKQAYEGKTITAITPEQIAKKLKRVNSPMIMFQAWDNPVAPGGVVNYTLGIYNPDPIDAINVFAHVWIGSGNVDPTPGTFLSNVDVRFARLTQPDFFGLTLAPGASATLDFALAIPAAVPKTNYLGNSCVMKFDWHDVGTYLDRSVFVFAVV